MANGNLGGSNDMESNAMGPANNNAVNGHPYLSTASYSQDQYASTNGQYESNFSGWNSGVTSRGSPLTSNSMMDHAQISRVNNNMGSLSQSNQNQIQGQHNSNSMNSMHAQEWQGQIQMRGSGGGGSQDSMPFIQQQHQMNYSSGGNDFNSQNNGNMISIGMNQSSNRSSNRFASSQMSQMGGGQGQSGNRNFIPGSTGTGGSNAQGRALNKMLLEILR